MDLALILTGIFIAAIIIALALAHTNGTFL